jgi:CHAT domain-containing protein
VGVRDGEVTTLAAIGDAHASLGEKDKALDYYNQSLELARTLGDRAGEAETLNFIGLMYTALGQRQAALQNYSLSLAEARQVRNPIDEANVLGNLMELWRRDGELTTAVFFGKQAVNKIQQLRANIRGFEKETQLSFLKSKEKTYRDLADLLITQGRLPEAEQVLDLLKEEEYFEFIRRDSKESSTLTAPVKLTKEEEAANRDYEANAARATAIGNEYAALRAKPKRTEEEEVHLKELERRVSEANAAWYKFLSDYFAELGKTTEANAKVESLEEHASEMQGVLRNLDPGTVALYTLVTDEKYRVMVITPNVMVPREYAIKADDLRKKVAEFRRALTDPALDPKPKAEELYDILVAPVAKELEGAKATTLMWSLDGVLRYLPIAALYDGNKYLVEKYRNTVFTPSSIPGLTGRPNVVAWRGLGMGVSKSYAGFQALPAVPEELHRIIREKGAAKENGVVPGQVMLDEAFTGENMEKALENKYPLVHIASHFDFAPGNDSASFLLLGGKTEQGERLSLDELRKNPAFSFSDTELLTLSACNTAVSGSSGDGREVDGIGFLAQRKGAKAVVASLWSVHDQSTGVLMEQFYKLWTKHRNMPKAEALREAQLALLRGVHNSTGSAKTIRTISTAANGTARAEYAHPFYWAPFILIGNWR